jgi:hypothetical protein
VTTDEDDRLAAWDALHDALTGLPGWTASKPQYRAHERVWLAVVVDVRHHGRGKPHEALEATGDTEAEAVAALAQLVEHRGGATP